MASSHRSHHRIIPAYHIKAQHLGDSAIEEYTNDILSTIGDDVREAIDREQTSCRTEIPTLYSVPGMNNSRAQRYVYFHVLRALKKAHYIPHIQIKNIRAEEQKVFIHTSWLTKEDRDMEHYMDKFIIAHQVGPASAKVELGLEPVKPISRRRRPTAHADNGN
jgi:hypothetical protein